MTDASSLPAGQTKMYNLSVGAIFKNEERAIKEWIEHYLYHGVEHFYLIDDNSTDSSGLILQRYVNDGVVTLFRVNHPYYLGRQRNLYNTHILPHIEETHWLLMVDLDEFVWSPRSINLCDVLASLDHTAQIQIEHTLFGSNGHVDDPSGGRNCSPGVAAWR
jgi:glycosyltransferase involved in cell wall biosynthesis